MQAAHVLPALIRKFHDARQRGDSEVVIWGTGTPRREFMYVDDLADACTFLMQRYDGVEPMNAGWGQDVSIRELAELIRDISGFSGLLRFDSTKLDGSPRKLLDISRLQALGWKPRTSLRNGIASTYEWFRAQAHCSHE